MDTYNEIDIVLAQARDFPGTREDVRAMVVMAGLTRQGFAAGDVSTVMSPRTVISWAENFGIFRDLEYAFILSFLNKCDEAERSIFAEYYQRTFGRELSYSVSSQLQDADQAS